MRRSPPWLDPQNLAFPDPEGALQEPNGLLALGGDLSPERILNAYRHGIFPWYEEPQPILWWSPNPRAVLFPEQFHLSRSLRKTIKSDRFSVTVDSRFIDVIDQCAALRVRQEGTWITPAMHAAYTELHRRGYAHSVEILQHGELVGGLYGLALGRVFFGESMFSLCSNASKVALFALTRLLLERDFRMIDCQVESAHLQSLGAIALPRRAFLEQLRRFALPPDPVGRWQLAENPLESSLVVRPQSG